MRKIKETIQIMKAKAHRIANYLNQMLNKILHLKRPTNDAEKSEKPHPSEKDYIQYNKVGDKN